MEVRCLEQVVLAQFPELDSLDFLAVVHILALEPADLEAVETFLVLSNDKFYGSNQLFHGWIYLHPPLFFNLLIGLLDLLEFLLGSLLDILSKGRDFIGMIF